MTEAIKVGLINENQSGHASFHGQLLQAIDATPDVEHVTYDLPKKGILRRAVSAALPLPAGWDNDFVLLRTQVAQSAIAARAVARLARECDVVHMYTQNACPLATPFLKRRPYVVTTDGTCFATSRMLPYRYPGRGTELSCRAAQIPEAMVLKRAHSVIAQSEWARQGLIRHCGVPEDRVRVLRFGAPAPLPWRERPDRRLPRVVFVGASMRRKGGLTLLDVLGPDLGERCELHLVTREHVPPRRGLVVHNDIWPGDGQIQGILSEADIFAFPTDMDMSPNAVLEAMAAGLPVVAYATGGIPEMVDDGKSGFVVPTGDRQALGSAIDALLQSASLRQDMGKRGRERLGTVFNRERATGMFVSILRDAAGGGWRRDRRESHGGPGRFGSRR